MNKKDNVKKKKKELKKDPFEEIIEMLEGYDKLGPPRKLRDEFEY